ncbi:hypothetical protein [Dokdonia sp. LLG6352-1]|uniref:hypothetical protein n=1 Tax=Dokdonia sp. LLG6352-1 TaxID=3160831 RepID=UPI0038689E54
MKQSRTNKYLVSAVLLGMIFHGTAMFFTVERTYDALIHLFFANHYATNWFEPWSYSWYTGFTVMGYPPLVHQTIGALSYIGGLKFGMFTVALTGVVLFITGVYRFTMVLIPNKKVAGYAAVLAVFSSSFVETLHIFGQLPSIIGISVLMHCLPEIYLWVKTARKRHLFKALALLSVTVTSHHVTPIFGMVFFIFPLLGMVVMDAAREKVNSTKEVTVIAFAKAVWTHLRRIIIFGGCSLFLIITCILPYWVNTKNNPITQVPIPHGSRDSFLEVLSSGLVFFVIPWGLLMFLLPYFFYRYYSKRLLFFGISFTLLFILGTGGTTPIPLAMLGENAFNILTLDRFTLWASIMALPVFGEFCYRFVEGDYKDYLQEKWGTLVHRASGAFLSLLFIFIAIFTITLGKFRPSQPDVIKMTPIVNFLNEDEHYKWRYLPLGFGDQMAWLSAQTKATTVDGDYHSARRLPELTTRAVERLENSKYRGIEGIGSLQQFLTVPEKYHLKYVFSNDKFYDPLLYFAGWHRLSLLENGIMVWEKAGIAPLPSVLPREDAPLVLKLMWGIIPFSTVILAILLHLGALWTRSFNRKNELPLYFAFAAKYKRAPSLLYWASILWTIVLLIIIAYAGYLFYVKNTTQLSARNVVTAYYDAVDFKEFERAHSYLDPESDKKLSQFMLEISVSDGLLSSYAKLDSLHIDITPNTDTTAQGVVDATWITPLKEIQTQDELELIKKKSKWYIIPQKVDPDIPPEQLLIQSGTRYYNHGKRAVTSEQTFHEDVLKQPVVEVLSARLVQLDTTYAIVGEIQNVDNIPADISVTGALYNEENEELARFNAKDVVKHKLLPKETTLYRINFEGIAWASALEEKPTTYEPDTFTEVDLTDIPVNFEVQVSANVATTDLYQAADLFNVTQKDTTLNGFLFNTSIEEATIPQLLIGYYNEDKELLWVESRYIDESVRQQRKRPFSEVLYKDALPTEVASGLATASVNGLPNQSISDKVVPQRNDAGTNRTFIPVAGMPYAYITIITNNYVGNPK